MNVFNDHQEAIEDDATSPAVRAATKEITFMVHTATATAGTLDIEVEWSHDGSTWVPFSTPDTLTQIAATGALFHATIPVRAPFFRLNYTVVTGPFTFDVVGFGF